jgi:ATP phosphoribosyltransferase
MTTPFVLAVPSKGRLQENAEAFFTRAGLGLAKPRGARDYRGTIMGLDSVEIAYLSASEIAWQLARGMVHLGVTGEDLVRETILDADKRVSALVTPMSWWRCHRPGSMSAPWPISTTSPLASAPSITGGCGWQPNTSI